LAAPKTTPSKTPAATALSVNSASPSERDGCNKRRGAQTGQGRAAGSCRSLNWAVADQDIVRVGPTHRGRCDRRAGYLGRTQVTDAGLKELTGLNALRILKTRATKVKDTGLHELATLTRRDTLDLGGTKVTDVELKDLQTLRLDATQGDGRGTDRAANGPAGLPDHPLTGFR